MAFSEEEMSWEEHKRCSKQPMSNVEPKGNRRINAQIYFCRTLDDTGVSKQPEIGSIGYTLMICQTKQNRHN